MWLLFSTFGCGILLLFLNQPIQYVSSRDFSFQNETFRQVHINIEPDRLKEFAEKTNVSVGTYLTVLMLRNEFELTDEKQLHYSKLKFNRHMNQMIRIGGNQFQKMQNFYEGIYQDIKYFPVPQSSKTTKWVTYENSWRNERTYGGKRTHEGTDIMAQENIAGKYPVVSMSDGIITNIGWLELGGYRIGITSEHGLYFYYAHLDSYAEGLHEGMNVCAGQFLGYMGNTGYGTEGTKGKFPVHLHMGVYVTDAAGDEYAVNPYWILKSCEKKVLYYPY